MSKRRYFISNFFIALFISFGEVFIGLGWLLVTWDLGIVFLLMRWLYRDIKKAWQETH